MPGQNNIEHKSVRCPEVKVSRDDKHLYIEGYGAYFGNVDSYGDVIRAGAFSAFLASEDAQRVKLCWQHNFDDVLGVITEMGEDERGLWFKATISNTTLGRDTATLIEDGALNEFSIGYSARGAEWPSDEETRMTGVERYLTEIYLYEISVVTRAANPMARLTDAERKEAEQPSEAKAPESPEETKIETNSNTTAMEEEELKNEVAEVKRQIAEMKADTKTEEALRNLDESVQTLHDEIKGLAAKKTNPCDAICDAIKSDEFKNLVSDVVEGKRASGKMEVKIDSSSLTGTILRTVGDTTINADAQKKLVFLDNIRRKDVPQDKSVVLWLEGSFTDNTDYVDEGAGPATANAATAEEKTRGLAKIAAKLPFTRETATDISYFLNWAREESITAIRNKVDTEILSGLGADTSAATKKKIYGIIGQGSTAFNAATAGVAAKFDAPGLIELVDAIDAQIHLGTNDAFVADTIYMHPSDFALYKNMKDKNGRLLFEYEQGGIYTFLGKRVRQTAKMTAGALIVADSAVFDLYEKLGFEIEIERVASTDSYVMYLRWRGQLVVPANKKKAVIYVASITSALAALTKAA